MSEREDRHPDSRASVQEIGLVFGLVLLLGLFAREMNPEPVRAGVQGGGASVAAFESGEPAGPSRER